MKTSIFAVAASLAMLVAGTELACSQDDDATRTYTKPLPTDVIAPWETRETGYAAPDETTKRVLRAAGVVDMIEKYARENGVPENLAYAVVQIESNFHPTALGSAGEIGLMQIKPATARDMGYEGPDYGLYDPETNIRFGMKYLGGAAAARFAARSSNTMPVIRPGG
jgi:soluble lytic murein transglycosylase-like protein